MSCPAAPLANRGYSLNLESRRKRRAAVRRILNQLEEIQRNETNYRDNIPDNLLDAEAYESADYCIELLGEAIDVLESAY